jgi:Flp pilus assembly protein TadG
VRPTWRAAARKIVRACGPGRRRRDESGAALVEFALILPVFSLMLFGMVQFGLAYTGWDQLRNGVQNAAQDVALNGQLCSGTTTFGDCETAIANNIGTPLGTTGLPTVTLYYNANPQLGPNAVFVCASVGVQSFTGFFGHLTLSSSSASNIEQAPNLNLQNTPNNCPGSLHSLAIPSTAGCTYSPVNHYLNNCTNLIWLDGSEIYGVPLSSPSYCGPGNPNPNPADQWLQIVPAGTSPLQTWQITDSDAWTEGTDLCGQPGPWTCSNPQSGVCAGMTTNVAGIPNFLNQNATPGNSALRSVG